jgi:hypothetical protein
LDAHESPLLTDQQVRDASPDQLENLVEQINLALRERGLPGWRGTNSPAWYPGIRHPARAGKPGQRLVKNRRTLPPLFAGAWGTR